MARCKIHHCPIKNISSFSSTTIATGDMYLSQAKIGNLRKTIRVRQACTMRNKTLTIHTLRTDNGGEYCNKDLSNWRLSKGIRHEFTTPHCPEQNGVAERANRTIREAARNLLHAKVYQSVRTCYTQFRYLRRTYGRSRMYFFVTSDIFKSVDSSLTLV